MEQKKARPVLGFVIGLVVFIVLLESIPFATQLLVVMLGNGWSDEIIKDVIALGNIGGVAVGGWAGFKAYKRYAKNL